MSYDALKRRLLQNPEVRERYENPSLALAVARVVVERRRELGMSQEDLAEKLGTSQNQIWRIESGQGNLRLDTLDRLRDVLQLHIDIQPGTRHEEPVEPEVVADPEREIRTVHGYVPADADSDSESSEAIARIVDPVTRR